MRFDAERVHCLPYQLHYLSGNAELRKMLVVVEEPVKIQVTPLPRH